MSCLRETANQTALALASELPSYGLRPPPRNRKDELICNQTTLKIDTSQKIVAGQLASMTITASGPGCSSTTDMLFYARLLGPSVVWVNVSKISICSYIARMRPGLPGLHILQVASEYCGIPWDDQAPDWYQPASYTGHLVLNRQLTVGVSSNHKPRPLCTFHREVGPAGQPLSSSYLDGFWRSTVGDDHSRKWQWLYHDCHLPARQLPAAVAAFPRTAGHADQDVRVLMLGDSVMGAQAAMFTKMVPARWTVNSSYLKWSFDYAPTLAKFKRDACVTNRRPDVVVYNSGLHDFFVRTGLREKIRSRSTRFVAGLRWDPQVYHEHLAHALDTLEACQPHALKIYRTTTAAWWKFGNIVANWTRPEPVWSSWHATEHVHHLESDFFRHHARKYGTWKILDGFFPTVSRPDCVENNPDHPEAAFIHPCDDALDAMNYELLSVIIDTWCGARLGRAGRDGRDHGEEGRRSEHAGRENLR